MIWLLEKLDNLYHFTGWPFLRRYCDEYEEKLSQDYAPASELNHLEINYELNYLTDMAQRCPKCEGYDFPGVSHNKTSAECSEYDGGKCLICKYPRNEPGSLRCSYHPRETLEQHDQWCTCVADPLGGPSPCDHCMDDCTL